MNVSESSLNEEYYGEQCKRHFCNEDRCGNDDVFESLLGYVLELRRWTIINQFFDNLEYVIYDKFRIDSEDSQLG